MGFILLVAYAEDFMAKSVYEGLTVGYCLALTQFVMVVVLGILYLRKADNEFDPLAQKAIERYAHARPGGNGAGRVEEPVGARAATSEVER
jgi:uncharacterized membrane protein (DUF485 family)